MLFANNVYRALHLCSNFTHYKNRFSMPGNSENYHYRLAWVFIKHLHNNFWICSWNIGPAHIISFSTEIYFFLEDGPKLIEWQYHWLEQELQVCGAIANRPTTLDSIMSVS